MSSTNRGKERNISDYYVTPENAISDFLNAFSEDINWQQNINGCAILDPCAGGDIKNNMSYPSAFKKYNLSNRIITVDYREDSKAELKENFLESSLFFHNEFPDVGMIISNPPFVDALSFIKKSLTISKVYVIFLLRVNFFGSKERKEWFQNHMPILTYVHSRRMKFMGTNNTDSIEYMHAVWHVDYYPRFTKLRII